MKTEIYAYLARKTNWTKDELSRLHPLQLIEFYNEVIYQESLEDWRNQYNVASIMAAIYNTIPRQRGAKTYQAKDFFDTEKPYKIDEKKQSEFKDSVDTVGIRLPKE